jgi:hypothetical protein
MIDKTRFKIRKLKFKETIHWNRKYKFVTLIKLILILDWFQAKHYQTKI